MVNSGTNIKILNANLEKTNIIQSDDLFDILDITLKNIIEILLESYGKYSTNTMVVYDQSSNVNVFTSDGIHKLKALEFISPIQNYLADLIRYIGECIEKTSRDGTTTGMLFTAIVLKKLMNNIKSIDRLLEIHSPYSTYHKKLVRNYYSKIYKNLMFHWKKELENKIVKIQDQKDPTEIIERIITVTGREFSHQLKSPLLEIFSKIPEEFYEYFVYHKSKIETDDSIWVEYPEWDYTTKVLIRYGYDYFNEVAKSRFREKGCNLIVCNQSLYDDSIFIKDTIEKCLEQHDKNITTVILIKACNDQLIRQLLEKYKDNRIIVVQYINYHNEILETAIELDGLVYGNNKKSNILTGVDILLTSGELKVNKIFNYSKKNKLVNSNLYNKKNTFFQKWVSEITELISELKNSHDKSNINELLTEYMRIYRKIVIPKYPVLKIGGITLDHLEMIDVIEDTLGSISISMKNGVINQSYKVLKDTLLDARENVIDITNNVINGSEFLPWDNTTDYILFDIYDIISDTLGFLKEQIFEEDKDFPFITNAKSVLEMIVRSKDVISKLLKCDSVIVPGSVVVEK